MGLSIGSSSIKLVELKKSNKGFKLLHFGIIQLPEDSIVNREIVNHISVVESIKTLLRQLKLGNQQVCTSLSGTSVIVKQLSLEVPNMKELQDQIFWEAEQYLPFDVSEVVMDYQVLRKSKDNLVDILLVAVKKTVLESYMSSVEQSGLKPKVVDIDFFALENLFEATYPAAQGQAVALVDIGASSTKLVVVQNGIPVFTKDSAIGGKNLTMEIQKHLNVSFADAESLKVGSTQQDTPQEVSELMNIMNENLASEIKRGIDFYSASSSNAPVSHILLAGGSSKIPGLSEVVSGQCSLDCQMINPFNSVEYDPSVFTSDYVQAIAPIAAVPMGLALRMAK